ncbi:hypothetical protein Afil01_56970 [Actinorhabdospora filicis]|uniref:PepSY domain-containing protein n=1 Tax=Actinorhabdospora filicis TaxID=1785913 RepID=A0A9W6SQ29_9ACTN|nr:PepSY domain-containing protein [Actinorhabdospora filicis]GLZ80890.1 hypothetical protein Afil01_56970 [Actinorhabdospora filicis]
MKAFLSKFKIVGRRRWIVLSVVAFVVLLGGGATAWATVARDGHRPHPPAVTAAPAVTVGQAADAALAKAPGVVHEVELKGPADKPVWEVEIFGTDGSWHEVTVDASSGTVVDDRTGRGHDDGDDHGGDRDRGRDDDHGRGHHGD